jgi:hypothetical protein
MSESKETSFETKCEILSDLWLTYRGQEDFKDFIDYNDLGLPAAFLLSEELATPSDRLKDMINESFVLLLASLEMEEDTGFDSLDDLLVG